MFVTEDIRYIGVNDHDVDLFEGQYTVENGMSYNSYVILDEKVAVMDTVDAHFGVEWLQNLETELNGRRPDYLVVQHMEPDHSANIAVFMETYPEAQIVSSAKAFVMMQQFFGTDFPERKVVVGEGSTLKLGRHTLTFVTAPMVHWPEVIVTYDSTDKVLFSADGFGKFGALDVDEDWDCEARRYYFNIVGKYGSPVQKALQKLGGLPISVICSTHGPIWKEEIQKVISIYNKLSLYEGEEGVVIAYGSMYGNTEKMAEVKLMKGNEVIAEAAIRCGCDGYFGYPITPQSEVMETLMLRKPWEETGMVVLQAESELAAINMVYGGASCGKKVMTSSSSPGISLKQEGITYIAGAELPCLVVDVMRGGPGLGTIQPSQSDYFQATKGGGHGDYHLIVLAPASVQEMSDFVVLGFELAFKYRNPAMVLADGVIGQMMEKVVLPDYTPRWTDEEIEKISGDWALTGKKKNRNHHIITSLELEAHRQEVFNEKLQRKYREIEANEVRYEALNCEDADYIFVAYGSCARICQKSIQLARQEGIKVGLLRPITLYPFPTQAISDLCAKTKGFLSIEMSAGQMVEDVRLAVNGRVKVDFYGRMGGVVPTPEEIVEALKNKFKI